MKRIVIAVLLAAGTILAQPQLSQGLRPGVDYIPGEIVFRLKDDVQTVKHKSGGVTLGVAGIDDILIQFGTTSVKQLYPGQVNRVGSSILKAPNGSPIDHPNLHNIYRLHLSDAARTLEAIDVLSRDKNVVYAEPNYIVRISPTRASGPAMTADELAQSRAGESGLTGTTPNDPLYAQQWYLPAVNIPAVWDSVSGDSTDIIAVLDTGVDWLHPELADHIWVNAAEANGVALVDDDANGYVDDVRGWDFINARNNPADDNGHGTHVAGIIAAKGNNGIGIAGVNWRARIMPVKVFQSTGAGDIATITQGIIYASHNGATIINMSFGTYYRSLTMEAALAEAYTNTVLVAAAGNDGLPIGPGTGSAPFYPAALSYVMGVQAVGVSGALADFSNRDPDGPVTSGYFDLLNYEMLAPGVDILSTVPQGKYRVLSGTSMAAPIVAGAISLYRSLHPGESQELMWGNLINTSGSMLDLKKAVDVHPVPNISYVSHTIVDTLDGDRDKHVDAGELIQLWTALRDTWGQADSVLVEVRFAEFEDTSLAQITRPRGTIGRMSPYSTRTNENNPLLIKFSSAIRNARDIRFEIVAWDIGRSDTMRKSISMTVENGQQLSGTMDSTLTLTANKLWLVTQSFRVGTSGHLIIKPGTQLLIAPTKYINIAGQGHVTAIGTPDSMITFGTSGVTGGIGAGFLRVVGPAVPDTFRYCQWKAMGNALGFVGSGTPGPSYVVDHCLFEDITFATQANTSSLIEGIVVLTNSVIRSISYAGVPLTTTHLALMEGNSFYDWRNAYICNTSGLDDAIVRYNNFVNLRVTDQGLTVWSSNPYYTAVFNRKTANANFVENNFVGNTNALSAVGSNSTVNVPNQYWGKSTNGHSAQVWDFYDDAGLPEFMPAPALTKPSPKAPALVWRVLLDGVDPQESVLNAFGPGKHHIAVEFNKPMDTHFAPLVSFGVRDPFTQHVITDSLHWSADSTTYSGAFTVLVNTGDGINTVRVADARDPQGFAIPAENQRFRFIIDAAGAASAGFIASGTNGAVNLEWHAPDVTDLLGYNLYRWTSITDTTVTDTTRINADIIQDTVYVDAKIVPGKKHFYQYRIVRSNFAETDPSKTVSASPSGTRGFSPVLLHPANNAVSQPLVMHCSWQPVPGATGYHLQLVSDTGMVSPGSVVANDTSLTDTSKDVSGLVISTLYYWRVRFQNPGGWSNYSLWSKFTTQATNSTKLPDEIPTIYSLQQNYPNPFNPSTTIRYGLPQKSRVTLTVFNIIGQQVALLQNGNQEAGYYEVRFGGGGFPSGMYFYRLRAGDPSVSTGPAFVETRKLILLR